MRIHIVCSFAETDRILPRMARMLAEGTGWSISGAADPDADLNYYFPYLEVRKSQTLGLSAGLFTHNETMQPGKVAIWESAAEKVGLRITWAEQYERQLQPYGETIRILPPLDRDAFRPVSRKANTQIVVGVSGYVYSGGRKGERLVGEVLKTEIGQSLDWRAIGRGWPRPLQTTTIPNGSLPAFYQTLDLYVCPSLIEGVPYGPLEALACGVPVVIPRGVGLLDELGDVPGIWRYKAGDAFSLEDALVSASDSIHGDHDFDPEELRATTERFTLDGWIDGHLEAFGQQSDSAVETARQSDHGIYVVAYGEPARDCAQRLIASIRTHMPSTPVAVASDRPLQGADLYVAAADEDLGGRAAKTRMWDNAPADWEHVLYLDADTELIAPIDFLFDALRNGWEVVCTKDVKDYETIHHLWRRDSKEHELGKEALGSDRALQLAGGVIGFRRTPATEAFLRDWYKEWHRLARRDQGALIRAMYAHPVRLLVLGNHWNTFQGGISPEESAGILHHRGGPARRVGGWKAGRMDSPEAFAGVLSVQEQRRGSVGVEGAIREGNRRFHRESSVTITNLGKKTARRQGRSGRNYILPPRIPVTVTGEDAQHIARAGEPEWEVSILQCPVCRAPDGACRGEGIAAKESNLVEKKRIIQAVRQHVDPTRGVAGVIGEEEGLVEIIEREPRFPNNGMKPTLKASLAAMSDEELAELGVARPELEGPELHLFEPNRGGVNCKTCRKNEENGDHLAPEVEETTDDANDGDDETETETETDVQLSGETEKPPAKRHRPAKAGAAKE